MAFQIDPGLLGLLDEVAVVTGGGGGGMGRDHCLQLAAAGCHIVVADVNADGGQETVELVERLGRKAVFVETNVLEEDQVERMVQTAFDAFGKLDVAVNHVGGGSGPGFAAGAGGGPFVDLDAATWEANFRQNTLGTAICCRAEARAMIEHEIAGRIINVSSTAGVQGWRNNSAYAATKASVINLTKSLAVELGPYNIRVNCISPGLHPHGNDGRLVGAEFAEIYAASVPLRRNAQALETGGLAVAFASKLTSFVTGQALASDGGMSVTNNIPENKRTTQVSPTH
jgi:NAD(P)-dependent dehydrogenase (short-subunit alcohol dehydrogenase family)